VRECADVCVSVLMCAVAHMSLVRIMAMKNVVICDRCKKRVAVGKCFFCKNDICESCANILKFESDGSTAIRMTLFGEKNGLTGETFLKVIEKGLGMCSKCWEQRTNFIHKLTFDGRCDFTKELMVLLNKFAVADSV